MKSKVLFLLVLAAVVCCIAWAVQSQESKDLQVRPMYGGFFIDGYDRQNDNSPRGTIVYDKAANEFRGTYKGLKMPKGRRAIFAWLHDTVNQKSEYLGPVGWLRVDTGGKKRGSFRIKVSDKYKGGNFGSYEIIGFTAEKTSSLEEWERGCGGSKRTFRQRYSCQTKTCFLPIRSPARSRYGIGLLRARTRFLLCQRPRQAILLRLTVRSTVFGL